MFKFQVTFLVFITQSWKKYGHSSPNLQKLAIKILNLTCSSSECEHNQSVFEQVIIISHGLFHYYSFVESRKKLIKILLVHNVDSFKKRIRLDHKNCTIWFT